jgi:hypothetical protein
MPNKTDVTDNIKSRLQEKLLGLSDNGETGK